MPPLKSCFPVKAVFCRLSKLLMTFTIFCDFHDSSGCPFLIFFAIKFTFGGNFFILADSFEYDEVRSLVIRIELVNKVLYIANWTNSQGTY